MPYPSTVSERVLNDLGIGSKEDLSLLEEIAWARGVLVKDDLLEGAEARLVVGRGSGIITVSTTVENPRRRRFSIAHELGHFEMHRFKKALSICLEDDINDGIRISAESEIFENEANEFASAFLLPERFFAGLCRDVEPSFDHIAELSDDFDVSLTATALRYLFFCNEPLAIVFSQNNRIRWFQGSKDFEEIREDLGFFIDVRSRLDPSTRAALFFQGRSIPPKARNIDAAAWFTPGRYHHGATIKEQSIAMPSHNSVLTLLWIDEEIDEDDDYP